MKKLKQFSAILLAGILTSCGGNETSKDSKDGQQQTITISGAFALYPLAVEWGKEYEKSHPNIRIDISAGGAGKGMADVLSGNVELAMVSRDINEQEEKQGAWGVSVTKDAVVATMNTKNPTSAEILKKGVKKNIFTDIWITGKIKTWGAVAGTSSSEQIQVFTRSDAAGAPETWAKYLGKKQEDLLGVGVYGDPGLAEAVKKDPRAIGFNNIVYVYDPATKKPHEGITVIPIDINENGILDPEESFYGTLDELMDGIAKGVYPSPPARELFFVSKGKVSDKGVLDFLNWVLTEGQKNVTSAGYVKLSEERIKEQINKLK
jgi:phosphate transport system substrate-binding protein